MLFPEKKPQQANQLEAGIRNRVTAGKITVAVIRISGGNVSVWSRVVGTIMGWYRNGGFEADIIYSPLRRLDIYCGYKL